ncbi:MAG TPA: hypothetical protein O0X39_04665 [Methanocorpusculum sp.]|nr:hypothetical protein [Methanocorpusculum sp.]
MFRQKDGAASDVIAFILIMGLVVIVVAAWMLIIIPDQGYQAESAHDEKVLLEFADLKKGIDLMWLNNLRENTNSYLISLAPSERTSLSTLLYLAPTLGSGRIKIEKGTRIQLLDTYVGMTISKSGVKLLLPPEPRRETQSDELSAPKYAEVNLLRVSYFTDNAYAPNYSIIYEGGVVFYADEAGNTYKLIDPFIDAYLRDNTKAKNYILIAADKDLKKSVLLGNLPVVINYAFTKSFNRFTFPDDSTLPMDYRRINGNVLELKRDYVELYHTSGDGLDAVKVYDAVTDDKETELNKNIADYWRKWVFDEFYRKELNVAYDPVTDDGKTYNDYFNPNGDIVQVKYYDVSIASGVSA